MTDRSDLRPLVEVEAGLTSITRLDAPLPLRYRGDGRLAARAHAGIAYLCQCADRATLLKQDIGSSGCCCSNGPVRSFACRRFRPSPRE